MKKFSKEAIIGLISIVALALLYFGFNFLKGINLLNPTNHFFIELANVRAIEVATPVYAEGFKVGLVRTVEYNYADNKAMVRVQIDLEKAMRIPKDSYAEVEESFLSGASIHLMLNKFTDEYVESGSYIEGRRKPEMMAELSDKLLPSVVELMPKIDSILASLNTIVSDPALAATFKHLEATTAQLEQSSLQLNQVMDRQIPSILNNADQMVSNLNMTSDQLSKIDFQSTFTTLDATVDNLHFLSNKFTQPDNTVGLLLNDKALYHNLNNTVESANNLLLDLKQNPKRYISIKLF